MYKTIALAACFAAALGFSGAIAAPAAKPTDRKSPISLTPQANLTSKRASRRSTRARTRMYVPLPSVSVNDQALSLVKKPNDNPTSQSLTQAADAERRSLQVSTPRPLIRPISTTKWRIIRASTSKTLSTRISGIA